ncbi:hypothetical protein DHEL01_v212412 [Diaporthe helianthi]|uniref:Uncharacterized protein n=1 Tax=Diaporthe helianthi TaxID=158607 RepID=A0A2P5HG19_DIAHE|nr:hypothetical protein DHEL01_v212412 [Diaporthe helianthi]
MATGHMFKARSTITTTESEDNSTTSITRIKNVSGPFFLVITAQSIPGCFLFAPQLDLESHHHWRLLTNIVNNVFHNTDSDISMVFGSLPVHLQHMLLYGVSVGLALCWCMLYNFVLCFGAFG